jgi:hypothetical protein
MGRVIHKICDVAILTHQWLTEREPGLKGVVNGEASEAADNGFQFVSSGYIDKRSSGKSICSMFVLCGLWARNDSGVSQDPLVNCDTSLMHQLEHTISYAVPICPSSSPPSRS